MTAYADNSEDAKALYHQVSETQKSITDMNAFADFKISIGGSILEDTGVDAMNLRMEMNMKMNHMTEPQQMRYMMYSRTTMDGMEEPMIISAYYQDGCYYQDSMGQKVKAGDKLITFDKALVESKGLCADVILIALDNPALPALDFKTGMTASAGETVVATW